MSGEIVVVEVLARFMNDTVPCTPGKIHIVNGTDRFIRGCAEVGNGSIGCDSDARLESLVGESQTKDNDGKTRFEVHVSHSSLHHLLSYKQTHSQLVSVLSGVERGLED